MESEKSSMENGKPSAETYAESGKPNMESGKPSAESGKPKKNYKEEMPFFHYKNIYQSLDPQEIAERCGLPFDGEAFTLRLMGTAYRVPFPDFALGSATMAEQILLLHYLCEGRCMPYRGGQRSYQEIPWGNVYYPNFRGRCILRLAHTFGHDLAGFRRVMETVSAEPLKQGDAGYRFEFITGLYMSLLLWAGDEEFPPSAQILFDDNAEFAFTAEDLAVAGEVIIGRLKKLR